jgi:PAS domain S-box-containing protein
VYQITRPIRDMCVFARQDLVRDPPFSRIDLISCRNVLIYLGPNLQRRVLPLFHYALKPNGFLLLGSSESVGPFTQLFTVVDKAERLHRKAPDVAAVRLDVFLPEGLRRPSPTLPKGEGEAAQAFDPGKEADRVLLTQYVPPAIVVDATGAIVHIRGETGPYLRPAPGKPSLHLLKMVREDLLPDLERALRQVRDQGVAVRKEGIRVRADDQEREVALELLPLRAPGGPSGLTLVLFRGALPQRGAAAPEGEPSHFEDRDTERTRLQEELAAARQYHQEIVEKYDGVTEDLRSAHEEVLSANEELQSTNEELETAKEELQATNEELSTVNDELRERNEELGRLNVDLENLFANVNVPLALVDANLRLRRITPQAERLFNVLPTDLNRRITDFKHHFASDDFNLEAALLEVIESLASVDREIMDRTGHWFSLRIRPYRSVDNRIDGAVIVLTDIHAIKSTLLENERGRRFLEAVFRTVPEPLLVLDDNLLVRTANRAYYRMFAARQEDTVGQPFLGLDGGQWDIPAMRALLDGVRARNEQFDDHEIELGPRTLLVSARSVGTGEDASTGVLLVIDDATENRFAKLELRRAQERRSAMFNQAFAGIAQADLSGKIALVNARFCEIIGREATQVLNLRFENLAYGADRARVTEALQRARSGARGVMFDARFLRGDDTPVWISADLSFVTDEDGKPDYALLIVQDISWRKQAEDEVRQLTDSLDRRVQDRTSELEAAVRELSDFSHTVSHDLRAPLRGMSIMSQLLLREFAGKVLDARGEGYVRRIAAAAARMDALVVNLLAYSRLGRMEVDIGTVDLGPLVDEVLDGNRAEAESRKAEIEVVRPLPTVVANRVMLAQAIENLLTNALIFTQVGSAPRVRIYADRADGSVRLWVEDKGIGISAEYQERVFGVFERLHAADSYPGTGIGLAIVRRAVERMGGTVGVESQLGKGSRFYVQLPEGNVS